MYFFPKFKIFVGFFRTKQLKKFWYFADLLCKWGFHSFNKAYKLSPTSFYYLHSFTWIQDCDFISLLPFLDLKIYDHQCLTCILWLHYSLLFSFICIFKTKDTTKLSQLQITPFYNCLPLFYYHQSHSSIAEDFYSKSL